MIIIKEFASKAAFRVAKIASAKVIKKSFLILEYLQKFLECINFAHR